MATNIRPCSSESIGAAGIKYTLIGLCIVPWIWSIPQALMTAELSSAMPAGPY